MTPRPVRWALPVLMGFAALTACSNTTDGTPLAASSVVTPTGTTSGATSFPTGPTTTTSTTGTPATTTPTSTTPASTGSTPTSTTTSGSGTCSYPRSGPAARKVTLPPTKPVSARTLTLSLTVAGKAASTVRIALTSQATPCTVNSIAHLARAKFYDRTRCHRLTTSGIYVLQCGDPTATGSGGPGYTFADELTGRETYPAGTVAMANAGPDTNGSQFFLVYRQSTLSPDYTVFGHITGGADTLRRVGAAGSTPAGDGRPKLAVVITRATAS